jgi:Cys-tRNA synthase (O-phospho-L-seryl-tRNA:Cys-tRNA synthase)
MSGPSNLNEEHTRLQDLEIGSIDIHNWMGKQMSCAYFLCTMSKKGCVILSGRPPSNLAILFVPTPYLSELAKEHSRKRCWFVSVAYLHGLHLHGPIKFFHCNLSQIMALFNIKI